MSVFLYGSAAACGCFFFLDRFFYPLFFFFRFPTPVLLRPVREPKRLMPVSSPPLCTQNGAPSYTFLLLIGFPNLSVLRRFLSSGLFILMPGFPVFFSVRKPKRRIRILAAPPYELKGAASNPSAPYRVSKPVRAFLPSFFSSGSFLLFFYGPGIQTSHPAFLLHPSASRTDGPKRMPAPCRIPKPFFLSLSAFSSAASFFWSGNPNVAFPCPRRPSARKRGASYAVLLLIGFPNLPAVPHSPAFVFSLTVFFFPPEICTKKRGPLSSSFFSPYFHTAASTASGSLLFFGFPSFVNVKSTYSFPYFARSCSFTYIRRSL